MIFMRNAAAIHFLPQVELKIASTVHLAKPEALCPDRLF